MTELALVAPPQAPQLSLTGGTGWHLVQSAWCLADPKYMQYARILVQLGEKVILDYCHPSNSKDGTVDVHAGPTLEQYLKLINDLEPYEAIIPDVPLNCGETLDSMNAFFSCAGRVPFSTRLIFVPQGSNEQFWTTCLHKGLASWRRNIPTVAVTKLTESFGMHREKCIEEIPTMYKIHFLGVWGGARELELAPSFRSRVRTWDMSLPIAAAQQGLRIGEHKSTKYTLNTDDTKLDFNCLLANVLTARRALGNGESRDETA